MWISVYYVVVRVVVFSEPLHTAVYSILYSVLNYSVSLVLLLCSFTRSMYVCVGEQIPVAARSKA
jgi:hypothetical protein